MGDCGLIHVLRNRMSLRNHFRLPINSPHGVQAPGLENLRGFHPPNLIKMTKFKSWSLRRRRKIRKVTKTSLDNRLKQRKDFDNYTHRKIGNVTIISKKIKDSDDDSEVEVL